MFKTPVRYLIVPGWQGSSFAHWQSHWQRTLPNAERVMQQDWFHPQVSDWVAALNQAICSSEQPVILIAHSLGCISIAHWAAQASAAAKARVLGALLVAPADVERDNCPQALQGFAPIVRQRLPFASLVVGSTNDPAASVPSVEAMAQAWGAQLEILPQAGHINVASGHHQWQAGFAYLYRLQRQIERQNRLVA